MVMASHIQSVQQHTHAFSTQSFNPTQPLSTALVVSNITCQTVTVCVGVCICLVAKALKLSAKDLTPKKKPTSCHSLLLFLSSWWVLADITDVCVKAAFPWPAAFLLLFGRLDPQDRKRRFWWGRWRRRWKVPWGSDRQAGDSRGLKVSVRLFQPFCLALYGYWWQINSFLEKPNREESTTEPMEQESFKWIHGLTFRLVLLLTQIFHRCSSQPNVSS